MISNFNEVIVYRLSFIIISWLFASFFCFSICCFVFNSPKLAGKVSQELLEDVSLNVPEMGGLEL